METKLWRLVYKMLDYAIEIALEAATFDRLNVHQHEVTDALRNARSALSQYLHSKDIKP